MARNTTAVRAASLAELAELLTGLDEFLRSGTAATSALTEFLASQVLLFVLAVKGSQREQ
jgi:hypothetical protein